MLRERKTDRQTNRHTDRKRNRDEDRHRERETYIDIERKIIILLRMLLSQYCDQQRKVLWFCGQLKKRIPLHFSAFFFLFKRT